MPHVRGEAAETRAGLEAGEDELVEHDDRETGQRDLQRMVVKERDTGERQAEEHEVERHAERGGDARDEDRAGEESLLVRDETREDFERRRHALIPLPRWCRFGGAAIIRAGFP